MPVPESFQTARLLAERLCPDHLVDLLKIHQDRRAMAELGGVRDLDETSRYLARNLEHWADHGFGVWMIREIAGDDTIGRVVLRWLSAEGVDDVEIGFALLPEFWGRGLATEISRCCLEFARIELDLKTLIGVTTPGNHASQRVLSKLGFQLESEITVNETRCLLHRVRWQTVEHSAV